MIFLANRANLDTRTLLSRLHNRFQTQVTTDDAPVEQVRYHTSAGNKIGVRATIDIPTFLATSYPVAKAELQVSFDFPPNRDYDTYKIQWVESKRELMIGWHQDDTHMDLGECHLQLDYRGETLQRETADFLDTHPLNVFEQRMDHLVAVLDVLTWETDRPTVPSHAVR
jgi:hypothetical protein